MLSLLPHVNAALNATSTALLLTGYVLIRRGRREQHRRAMLGAFAASTLFLVGYLTRFAMAGTTRFPDAGWVKGVYLAVLFSHMLLAAVVVPIVLRLLYLALSERFAEHKRLARWGYPVWLYVSVTGVLVYAMLYHLAPRLG